MISQIPIQGWSGPGPEATHPRRQTLEQHPPHQGRPAQTSTSTKKKNHPSTKRSTEGSVSSTRNRGHSTQHNHKEHGGRLDGSRQGLEHAPKHDQSRQQASQTRMSPRKHRTNEHQPSPLQQPCQEHHRHCRRLNPNHLRTAASGQKHHHLFRRLNPSLIGRGNRPSKKETMGTSRRKRTGGMGGLGTTVSPTFHLGNAPISLGTAL